MPHALLVEDDEDTLFALAEIVERKGFDTSTARSFADARSELKSNAFDLVLLDVMLPGGNGLDLLMEMSTTKQSNVILMTGVDLIDSALRELPFRQIRYVKKPVDVRRFKRLLDDVRRGLRAVDAPRKEIVSPLIGESPELREIVDTIARVAPTDAPVLIVGESGTGKELVAQALHDNSPRKDRPFVACNAGAIPESLIDSELFGHVKGAFTGAVQPHKGMFEQANGGSLFLDEITEMPMDLQVRLLRVLEEGKVKRLGSTQPVEVDCRIISATNRNPTHAVVEGKLREDLLYRLAVFPIEVPPLRARPGDIDILVRHFLAEFEAETGNEKKLDDETLAALKRFHWPGNVRQLRNAVHRAFIMSKDVITPDALPPHVRKHENGRRPRSGFKAGTSIAEAERLLIEDTLEHCGGDKAKAAAMLGISLRTLYNRLKEYGRLRDADVADADADE